MVCVASAKEIVVVSVVVVVPPENTKSERVGPENDLPLQIVNILAQRTSSFCCAGQDKELEISGEGLRTLCRLYGSCAKEMVKKDKMPGRRCIADDRTPAAIQHHE